MARIAWALLANGGTYRAPPPTAPAAPPTGFAIRKKKNRRRRRAALRLEADVADSFFSNSGSGRRWSSGGRGDR